MKRKLLKIFFSISPILIATPFLYFGIEKINIINDENKLPTKDNYFSLQNKSSQQKIVDYYEIKPDNLSNVKLNPNIENILEENAYSWEVPYILNYESTNKLKYNDSLITKKLFNIINPTITGWKDLNNDVTHDFNVNDLSIYEIETIRLNGNETIFSIYLSDSENNILKLNDATLLQFKKTTPNTKVTLNENFSDIDPSEICNNKSTLTQFLKNIIVYTTFDIEYDGYRILPFNNKNEQMKTFYDNGTISVPIIQPSWNTNIQSWDDENGTIELNITLTSNNDFFSITGFNDNGSPFEFNNIQGNSYSFNYQIVTRPPKESRPWIFRGEDGNFLMWTIISCSILIFINIIATIIFYTGTSKKEYKAYRRNLHRSINRNTQLENRNLSNSRLPYNNTTNTNLQNKLEYNNTNRNRSHR